MLSIGLLAPLLAACSSQARFLAVAGPVQIDEDLPPPNPEEYLADGIAIRIFTPNLDLEQDPGFAAELGRRLQERTRFRPTRGTGKKPAVEVLVYEGQYNDARDPSEVGGLIGAIAGASAVYGITKNPWAAAGGGGIFGIFGYFAGQEKFHTWSFGVVVKQKTTLEGVRRLESEGKKVEQTATQLRDVDFNAITSADQLRNLTEKSVFETKTNTLTTYQTFLVSVNGKGLLFTRGKAWELAKEKIAAALPGYLVGGTVFQE
jgi:hypothetical protein